jgi:hypothetical protein
MSVAGGHGPEDQSLLGREALPTGESVSLSPEEVKARQRRSLWIALALGGFVVLVFVLTVTRLGPDVLVRDI